MQGSKGVCEEVQESVGDCWGIYGSVRGVPMSVGVCREVYGCVGKCKSKA